jgi:hypothetical protein
MRRFTGEVSGGSAVRSGCSPGIGMNDAFTHKPAGNLAQNP